MKNAPLIIGSSYLSPRKPRDHKMKYKAKHLPTITRKKTTKTRTELFAIAQTFLFSSFVVFTFIGKNRTKLYLTRIYAKSKDRS
ncbi:hypothetical protein SDJN02_27341, partial [Cucurbita argyrosperma subsp. argyrosperma]